MKYSELSWKVLFLESKNVSQNFLWDIEQNDT